MRALLIVAQVLGFFLTFVLLQSIAVRRLPRLNTCWASWGLGCAYTWTGNCRTVDIIVGPWALIWQWVRLR